MLTKASWLPLAEALDLQEGRSRRVNHDCGEGRTLKLSRANGWLNAYCWRCNDKGSHKLEESLADRVARLAGGRAADEAAQARPLDDSMLRSYPEWPQAARLWLARAGLSSQDAGRLGASFHIEMGRVILPCGGGFWQARAVDNRQPKYLAPLVPKNYPSWGVGDRITLVEDILSAYKVGKAGASEGWCMLGTSLPQELLVRILLSGKQVLVWLDNDLPPTHPVNRGQMAAAKVLKQLRAAGVDARNIVTERDPKLIPLDEIRKLTS